MVRRTKQNAADTAAVSSHLSDTSSLSSDPPGGGNSDNGSDDDDDDDRQRGVRPKSKMPVKASKQAAGAKSKTTSKSKQSAAAASKAKGNRTKNIPEKKSKDSRSNLKKSTGTDQQYCICRGGYNGKEFMVACDSCQEWFHGRCIGIAEKDVPDHYFCTNCKTTSLAVENEVEHSQVKKGKNASKSKVKNAKAKSSKKKPTPEHEQPAVTLEIASPKAEVTAVDIDDSDEDLDDICPVCDSVCTCGTKTKEDESNPTITVSASFEDIGKAEPELVHDSGVIEIIGEDHSTPKRSKAKSKASERKSKANRGSVDKNQDKNKDVKSKKGLQKSFLDPQDITDDDDEGSIAENVHYQSDVSEAAFSHSSQLEGPVYSLSEGSVHIDSGDDEDIEEEEERALIEQWELIQDQDELSSASSEEDYDLDDEETMALMLEDQYETDEEMYTSDLVRHTNGWSSDEDDEDDFDEEQYNLDIADDNEEDAEFIKDDEEDYSDDDEDGVNMQFSPFFDESTDVSELLDNIAAALALSISLPGGPGEEAAADLTQQLQKALVEAGIDLSALDENRSVSSLLEQADSSSKIDSNAANDSDVDITGTPEDVSATSPTHSQIEESKILTNDTSTALSQSLVNDLLLATGNSGSSDIKLEPDLMAAAVQDLVNAVNLTAKQDNDSAENGNNRLLELIANSSQPSISPGDTSNIDPMESTSTALKREAEEEILNDRQQRARLGISQEENAHDGDKITDDQAVLIDDLVDTSRLYTRSTSRSPSPDPAETNRFSQDLSRWQRVPIGTFRRSRRISAPMIHASSALRSGNDEFASTLLSDLHAGSTANQVSGNSVSTDSDVAAKKRRRSKQRGRSAAKSMSDLASIIQRSKDLLPSTTDSGGQNTGNLSLGLPSTNALAPSLSMAIASAVAAIRQSSSGQGGLRINRRQRRLSSLSSALDTDQPPSSACSSPLYSPLFSGIRHNDISVPDLHLDDVVAELQKQEDREKSAAQKKGRRPSKLSSS
ncbi:hypothetical protein NQZ79_g5159 [Umbelopsis isabellina]|nr:hypothetical protein NQZ79_g5159 [Umbelopsis isabellina]